MPPPTRGQQGGTKVLAGKRERSGLGGEELKDDQKEKIQLR